MCLNSAAIAKALSYSIFSMQLNRTFRTILVALLLLTAHVFPAYSAEQESIDALITDTKPHAIPVSGNCEPDHLILLTQKIEFSWGVVCIETISVWACSRRIEAARWDCNDSRYNINVGL